MNTRKQHGLSLIIALFSLLAMMLGSIGTVAAGVGASDVCDELDSGKIDVDAGFGTFGDDGTGTWAYDPVAGTVTVTAPDGYLVSGYCVKAGSAASGGGPLSFTISPTKTFVIDYPDFDSISHFSVSLVLDETEQGQWCSPGYWRQDQHLGSWEATGISPDELYSEYFSLSTLSKKAPEGANPTLWEVLQDPETYGGAAFNNVGDLLSANHPDVNFLGERIEDSCPLN